MTQAEIKAAVRERDGMRCTKCGMTNQEHIAKYRDSLDVHRLDPGTKYTVDGCVTVCKPCHGPLPGRKAGAGETPCAVRLDLPVEHHCALRTLAAMSRRSMASFVRDVIVELCKGSVKIQLPPPVRNRPVGNPTKTPRNS